MNDLKQSHKKLVYENLGILDQMKTLNKENHQLRELIYKNKEKQMNNIKSNECDTSDMESLKKSPSINNFL